MTTERISVGELQELLAAGGPVTVVDVRSPSDVDWEIPGSIHIDAYGDLQSGRLGPLTELNLSPGPVVTICGVGRTAAIATDLLRANGVEALTLDGGMRAWSLAWNTAQTTIFGCEIVQVRRTGKGCLSYIVESESEAVVIDVSIDPDVYIRILRDRGWRLVAVADTHIHADHLSRSKLLAHLEGAALLLPAQDRTQYPFRPVADGDRIAFGSTALVATHTPGHTEESTTYLLDSTAAFTGDTLFLNSVGRPDLDGGTRQELASRARLLYLSIHRLLQLPDAAQVLPGHVSEPIHFDGRMLATTVGTIRDTVTLARLDSAAFVDAVLARISPNPPNHSRIVELNERGEFPGDPSELEAGANRCAIA
ncbi:MAG TPA: MBL fold metallo-hydrolase [Candidatus Dormibacteraeota bacterium]|nr:MBL fold metallo-hydrolase [Candidatus Dormibacteraeota bacterium]